MTVAILLSKITIQQIAPAVMGLLLSAGVLPQFKFCLTAFSKLPLSYHHSLAVMWFW